MVEGEMHEVSEAEMVDVIKVAHEAIKKQCQFQLDLASEIPSSSPKREYCHEDHNEEVRKELWTFPTINAGKSRDKVWLLRKKELSYLVL